MKHFLTLVLFALALSSGGSAAPPRVPVLLELFTSEGCSSCPPADALLARLVREQPIASVEIIAVEFHVDYWDHHGWKDPFASKAFTARQKDYSRVFGEDRVYTPQMVVDGRDEFVGSDEGAARRLVEAAASRPHLPLRVDARVSADGLRLSLDLPAAPRDAEPIDVMVALTEDDLTSAVRRGENTGKSLTHVAVVRKLELSGTLGPETFVANGQMRLERGWNPAKMRAVTWLQGRKSRHVYATAVSGIAR
jgi:hypothetical protein